MVVCLRHLWLHSTATFKSLWKKEIKCTKSALNFVHFSFSFFSPSLYIYLPPVSLQFCLQVLSNKSLRMNAKPKPNLCMLHEKTSPYNTDLLLLAGLKKSQSDLHDCCHWNRDRSKLQYGYNLAWKGVSLHISTIIQRNNIIISLKIRKSVSTFTRK